jgi:carbohydrate-binding DOMON domain-containing protein
MVSSILGDATALFTLPAVSDIMGPFLKQQEELLSAFRRQISASDVYPLMKSVRDQQEQVGRAVRDMAQLTASSRIYVGSTDSIRFHRLTCRYVNRILADNLIQFTGRDDAVAKGYVPCDTCKP